MPWRAPITAVPVALVCSQADAVPCDPVPGDRSGRDLARPGGDPLVCARLYRRAADRLALLPLSRRTATRSGRTSGRRRLPGVGDARRRPRRARRLRSLLQARLLRLSSARGALRLAWRDVVPR